MSQAVACMVTNGDTEQLYSERQTHLVDHVLQLGLGRVLTQRAHDSSQLLGGDGAITVLVEKGERLLELSDLLLCKQSNQRKQRQRKAWGEAWRTRHKRGLSHKMYRDKQNRSHFFG